MKQKLVGEVIYYCRKDKKISQTQLSKGLCSISTLSRIESGERSVDSLLVENLLQRLGKSSEQFEFVLDYVDFKLSNLRYEIMVNLNNRNDDLVNEQLNTYRELADSASKIHLQFISMVEIELLMRENANSKQLNEKARKVVKLTIPDFTMDQPSGISNYSLYEVRCILHTILTMESIQEQCALIGDLYHYVEINYDSILLGMVGPEILYHYARILLQCKEYQKAIDYCDTGIAIIQKAKSFMCCADICYVQACAIYQLIDDASLKDSRLVLKAQERIRQAYWTYMMEGNQDMISKIEQTWKELI